MKHDKIKEYREKTESEIKGLIKKYRDELFFMRFKKETAQLKDTQSMCKRRKEIARLLTILKERDRLKAKGR